FYTPGSLTVVVRERGDRELMDVPRSEVAALAQLLREQGNDDDSTIKRAILDAYRLVRMTTGVSAFLDGCLTFKYRV
ncbi:MAG: hypothetical protein ACRDVE_18305, partial [Actinocrinis sp.]